MPNNVIDQNLRDILINLAAALLPLDAWVKGVPSATPPRLAKAYVPPNAAGLPWRAPGQSLHVKDLGVIEVLESLLAHDGADQAIENRWLDITADPLKFNKQRHVKKWRHDRGLGEARFRPADSDNVIIADGIPGDKHAVSRMIFYQESWTLLRGIVQPSPPNDWTALAELLFSDKHPQWPTATRPKSSEFIKVFMRDVLIALLNMTGAQPDPQRMALAIEVGEFRRPGNAYTIGNVQVAMDAFKKKFKEVAAKAVRP